VDTAANGGNISGDPAVALEFDSRLPYTATTKTFFGKFVATTAITACANEGTVGCAAAPYFAPASFVFAGDGREPLGDHYAFRYLADASQSLQSWIQVWRSDLYGGTAVNLCGWANPATNKGAAGSGFYDAIHQVGVLAYDADENLFGGVGIPPGPSGQPAGTTSNTYIFLESQRINLAATADWNPAGFKFGWVDLTLRGATMTGAAANSGLYNMGWVGVQHTAPGAFISVGHAAANLNNQFQCQPSIGQGTGTQN
jgi:hypothetical protein